MLMYKGILKCTCYGLLLGLLSGTYTHANPNGAQAINGQVSGYFNVVTPDSAPDYQFRATLTFLFPK